MINARSPQSSKERRIGVTMLEANQSHEFTHGLVEGFA
jgi:hypothetical protein